jgi:hypothetical protein
LKFIETVRQDKKKRGKMDESVALHSYFASLKPEEEGRQELHFVSLGSAALLEHKNKNLADLAPEHNQQFPLGLQALKEKYPALRIRLILIDPLLTSPPFEVLRREKEWQCKEPGRKYIHPSGIDLFMFRTSVSYNSLEEEKDDEFKLAPYLLAYSSYCIASRTLLLLHDFSGRHIGRLASDLLSHNLIQVGMGYGADEGSYPDLSSRLYFPLLQLTPEGFKFFNPSSLRPQEFRFFWEEGLLEQKRVLAFWLSQRYFFYAKDLLPFYRVLHVHLKKGLEDPTEETLKEIAHSILSFTLFSKLTQSQLAPTKTFIAHPTLEGLLFLGEYSAKILETEHLFLSEILGQKFDPSLTLPLEKIGQKVAELRAAFIHVYAYDPETRSDERFL